MDAYQYWDGYDNKNKWQQVEVSIILYKLREQVLTKCWNVDQMLSIVVLKDLVALDLSLDVVMDWVQWRARSHLVVPNLLEIIQIVVVKHYSGDGIRTMMTSLSVWSFSLTPWMPISHAHLKLLKLQIFVLTPKVLLLTILFVFHLRRSPISIAAAVIYIVTQLSDDKKPLKGKLHCWLRDKRSIFANFYKLCCFQIIT